MEKVTLYIPCFNAAQYLQLCLESVLSQSYPIDEILIIDDGSTDDTVCISEQFPVKIIKHFGNKGLAAARNTAFKEAKNEFIAALDADCLAKQNWLYELMNNFKDEKTAGVGGKLIEKYNTRIADRWRAQHMRQGWGDNYLEDPPFLFGNNTVIKKRWVSTLGLYDEKFKTNFEDVDISRRMLERGLQLVYSPKALVEHLKRDSVVTVLNSFWEWSYYSHLGFDKKDNTLRRFFSHIGILAIVPKFLSSDIKSRSYEILVLDILMLFYLPLLSINDLFKKS